MGNKDLFPEGHRLHKKVDKPDLTPPDIMQVWNTGYHVNKEGVRMAIKDIPDRYLQNIIDSFKNKGYDVSTLQHELISRASR